MNDIINIYLCFSGLFMVMGVLFEWHSFKTYEASRKIMETLTDMILKSEGTDE